MATPVKRSFEIIAADGRLLHGDLRSAGGVRPVVVMCHGSEKSQNRGFLPELADRLARAGFAVVSFDFSSENVAKQPQDLARILDAVRRGTLGHPTETYGLIGQGTGGVVALLRTAADNSVRAVVTLATAEPRSGDDTLRARWLNLLGPAFEIDQVARASIDWLARHLK